MKKILILIGLIMLSAIISYAAESEQELWEKVDANTYIYSDGIVGTDDIYGFTFLLKSYNKGQYEPVNGKTILYTLSRYKIDCAKNLYKIGVIDAYGEQNNFVNGDYNKYAQFQPIVSGTAVSAIAEKLCRP